MSTASQTLYVACWEDFLSNRWPLAEKRARAGLAQLSALNSRLRAAGATGVDDDEDDIGAADRLVSEADFSYIAGATSGNDTALLDRAIRAYRSHLVLVPTNVNARRMLAEAQLRLRRYEGAFATFDELRAAVAAAAAQRLCGGGGNCARESALGTMEVAPFRLLHDAAMLEYLACIGELAPRAAAAASVAAAVVGSGDSDAVGGGEGAWLEAASALRQLAAELQSPEHGPARTQGVDDDEVSVRLCRARVATGLSAEQRKRLLVQGRYDALTLLGHGCCSANASPSAELSPLDAAASWPGTCDPLRTDIDWHSAQCSYARDKVVVIDDLFSAPALAELQRFCLASPAFRTMRGGFLGAFPGDGAGHPIVLALARHLEAAAPEMFASHPLGLFWFFKYPSLGVGKAQAAMARGEDQAAVGPGKFGDATPPPPPGAMTKARGIGIHADPAAVNINIWLTPDEARLHGGGLDIFRHVPPLAGTGVTKVNREFSSAEEEHAFRADLEAKGPATHVPYACNRAAIFVSDQYHVSEPFEFRPGHENHRVNLTLLFGDRLEQREGVDGGASGAGSGGGGAVEGGAAAGGPAATAQQAAAALFGSDSSSDEDDGGVPAC
jgi:hypothetical protein